ncbi:unnamed protein product [Schistosoma margrebowiei]|uniref:BUD13 homolog n=1 Tax=Schistosoma margrebowiei TaxID=48269 RepID=A0AA85AMQ4_9TREM|nr:unnamed protein product [Schistosoma margrebowiei]
MNSVFIVITMIIMIVGLGLLISCAKWYELIISLSAATGFTIVAILMGIRLDNIEMKFKMILFMIFCVATVTGFILFLIGLILKEYVLESDAWLCWGCVVFTGIIFTTDYLHIHLPHNHQLVWFVLQQMIDFKIVHFETVCSDCQPTVTLNADGFEFPSDPSSVETLPKVVRQATLLKDKKSKQGDKSKKEAELEARYDVWNKGIKTLEETYNKLKEQEYESSKPLARYASDKDLTEHLKSQIHSEDPMAQYFVRKSAKKKRQKKSHKKKKHKRKSI